TLDTEIHTSCSIPILLGMEFGSFTIRDGASRNGGQTCSVDGYIPVGHLCGTVYEDANANGLFDSTETSQAAIGVNIVDIFGVSTRLNTDVDGSYCNYNVAQGNASVTVDETTLPEGTSLINGENPNSVSVIANTVNDAGLDGYMFAPTANDQNITLNANTQKSITLSGVDKSNRSLSYIILTQPLHGALSGVAPNMVYTPYTDYEGTDSFTFKVNNGVLDSDPATVNLTVIEPNYPPEIISTPLQKIDENSLYTYDVNALDPNKKDVLTYSTLKAPSGLNIDNTTGLITWEANALYAQSVPTFNKQCYTIPTEAEPISSSGGDTSYIVPIFQDVKTAISKGSDYIAPQTVAWDKRNGCLGCHVQTQTLVGLQASAAKADVDEAAGEYLLAKILRSQQSDGSIRNSYPGFSRTQTAFGLWSLSYVPDSDRTFNVRANALRFFYNTKYSSGSTTRWSIDHQTGWLRTTDAITATVLFGASRYLTDYKKQTNPTAIETDMANKYTNELPRMVQYLLSRSNATPYNYINALHMVGMAEAKIHITDETLLASINAKIETLETLFRSRQNSDGGWSYYNTGVSDPMTSAWVGLALNYQNPPLTDDAVLRNIKYLLNAQRSDGTWKGSLFSTYLGTTSLVMAYLPVALEFLGNPDMSASNVVLDDKAMTLSAQITNRGLGDVTVPLEVRFFNGSPDANDLLGVTTLQGLPSDAQQNVNISLDRLPNEDVFVVLSATAATPECELGNNVVRTAFVQVDAADPEGLFDQQSFLINVLDVNEAPVIISEALPNLPIGLSYNYQIEITDKDVGDAHIFALEQAPQGLFIDAHSGKIQYDLEQIVAGSYEVIVKVTDLQGLSSAKTFTLIVEANTHPFITSTPGTEVRVAQTYQYAVVANDNDGDQLEYTLETSPLTMDINTSSGLITWTPLPIHEGLHLVKIVVKDGRGGISTQSFSLYVIANNPPIITSTPLFEGVVDHLYRYQVVASDPDLDALSYTLLQSPIGMHIDEQGEITFTPQYGDRGMHAVVVEVKDAYESGVQQSYMLNISLAQNLPPVITILGDNPLVLLQGSTFVDPGAVAVDDVDGNISVHASHQINTNILGQYLVTYTATDSQQNMATTYRAVYIVDSNYAQPDITPPSITVLGDNPHRLTIGDSYTDAGATAWDNRDGSVSVGVSYSFNTSVEGTYQVTYTAVDSAGNSAKAYRSVMVVDINTPDTTPPVMVILGDNPLTILQGESYNDPGANVVDDHDGQIGYSLRHNVNSTQVGTYTVIYSAIDIAGNSAEATRTVYVKDPNGNRAPIADAGGDLVVALEQNVTLDGSLSQDLDGEIIAYEWSENSTILSTDVAFTKVGLSRGIHEITLKVTDNEGAFSTDTVIVRLIDENDTTAPTALITSPTEDTIVKLQAEIVGTAYDENLAYYELFFSPVGKNTYNLFADGNASVTDGVLGTFNGSTINNGIYDIMLRVVDLNGEVTNAYTRVIVKGKAKIGNFSFTVTDFDINVAGIPVKVNRTYSTLQRFEKLDFGYAWSVDYQNVKIEENIHPGEEWRMDPDLFAIGYCFKPKKQHIVNISLPDGTTESFELKFEIECAHYFPNNPYDAPKYYALNGSEAKLEPIGTSDATSMDNYGRLLDWLTLDIYNPSKYRLSLSNGMVYELDQEFGIERVIDNRGDTLTYNNNGIVSSRGVALTFERDDQNRITRITDLADKNVTYHYDGNDDLDYIIDQMGYTTTYKYQAGHLMEEYFDPSGTRITKNIYDDAGRLIKMIDPDG
ncbi:immunoglobulin-like domain-containing protein, partial [Sulfurovum sp.]|uniref:immunoglobulin-like domain-containing protein n=1 Tax=Sulfurovum sp. TaxID=1969726 RepID=UPI00356A620D